MTPRAFPLIALLGAIVSPVSAADLYPHDGWSALAADNRAHHVGDLLTVVVYETSAATNTASSGTRSSSSLGGQISAGSSFDESAHLGLDSSSDHSGTTGRSGGMVAQISVAIQEVLPNGDLRVQGAQVLNINGDQTNIRIAGRVRPIDISASNTVLSTRLADATIDYDGTGFVSQAAQPGVLTRIFTWLGIP